MSVWTVVLSCLVTAGAAPDDSVVRVDAGKVLHRVSRYLYGACIEDVNHEIYGGLYSQMVFGESFQEPPPPVPIRDFTTYGGVWTPGDGGLAAEAGDGPKLIARGPVVSAGEASVDLFFPDDRGGNAGLIVKVDRAGKGADAFTGYEVSLESRGLAVLGRHRQNWELLRTVECPVPIGRWVTLTAVLGERTVEVRVDGKPVITYEDREHPLAPGRVGLRTWQRPAKFRSLRVTTAGETRALPFVAEREADPSHGVSGMWSPVVEGSARHEFALVADAPFVGRQSQRITFKEGEGAIGIVNFGLNRWGMNLVKDRPYEGRFWARATRPGAVSVRFQSRDGKSVRAATRVEVTKPEWSRYEFRLEPQSADGSAGLALVLTEPGSVDVGYVSVRPGEWGRYKRLPDRKDVGEAMVDQGLTVLRYGGSMVNHPEYRWKSMIGPRDRRPPHHGTWYPYSTNGWGIFDFLNFCEAAGFLAIPAVYMGESPQDMADFVEYVNGPADSPWGRRRVADGHPAPYRLKHVELGNEEAVNEAYWNKFRPMAEAMWAKDPGLILVVGDFAYGRVIDDPYHFQGGVAVNTLEAHRKILELARKHGREVWFDIHISTEQPPQPNGLRPERSYIEQLGKIAPGANYKVAIFEYNSNNHQMRRALSNALATHEVERVGDRLAVACSANALQPDGQNDNGWNQGLLFLNPSKVWLQPPGYVTKMASQAYQPLLVDCRVEGPADRLSVNAKRSDDGRTLVLTAVNWDDRPRPTRLRVDGFRASRPEAEVEVLAAPPDATNTAAQTDRVTPRVERWSHGLDRGEASYTFPPHSFTVIRLN